MLEVLMDAWLSGAVAAEGVESFAEFQSRVKAALRAVLDGASGRDVVVITSGGPIGLCVQEALEAPAKAFLAVNWRMRNASITEFTFSSSRFTLDTLNGLPHLEDRSLWTWR
jgi:broad specificity phosphatase PhoE